MYWETFYFSLFLVFTLSRCFTLSHIYLNITFPSSDLFHSANDHFTGDAVSGIHVTLYLLMLKWILRNTGLKFTIQWYYIFYTMIMPFRRISSLFSWNILEDLLYANVSIYRESFYFSLFLCFTLVSWWFFYRIHISIFLFLMRFISFRIWSFHCKSYVQNPCDTDYIC